MPYHYEATSDFASSIAEVETLIDLASNNDENRDLFLKLATVSSVTKFQVFVEKVLNEFRYELLDKPSRNLSTYIKMNSLRISLDSGNPLINVSKHRNYTDDKKNNIVQYINSLSYLYDEESKIQDTFLFETKFPLGKTGKNELVNLLKQIDGEENPFQEFGTERFDNLDSILMQRHAVIHQDRFNGTETTVKDNLLFLKSLVEYIDSYLISKIQSIEKTD